MDPEDSNISLISYIAGRVRVCDLSYLFFRRYASVFAGTLFFYIKRMLAYILTVSYLVLY